MVPVARPGVHGSGGATVRGGGELTVKTASAFWSRPPRMSDRKGTREALGTYWDDPEPRRLPEASRRRRGLDYGDLAITALRSRPQGTSD